CDGTGACERFSGNAGVVCAAEMCVGSTRTTTGTCDSQGGCSGATTQPCTPYQCATDGKSCRTTCSTDADCVAPNTCVGGSCGKKPIGASCGADAECNSMFCAQGRCCMSACAGTCKSCAVAGSEGTCKNVPDGMDPLGQCNDATAATPATQCTDMGGTSCGTDGKCDGAGACRKYAAGANCGGASCTGSTLSSPRSCDGMGTCRAATTSPCAPYQCGTNNACKTTCTTTAAD